MRSSSTTVGSTSPSGGGTSASNCLSLQPVPEELARTHPELSSYRLTAIGDQVVLVDRQQQKIVQVIDRSTAVLPPRVLHGVGVRGCIRERD